MKKGTTFCFLLLIGLIMFSSFSVSAKSLVTNDIKINDYAQVAAKKTTTTNGKTTTVNNKKSEFENNEMICEGDGANAILGSTEDPNSVAWLIQEIMNYLKVIGPFLILILSSIEFVRAILTSDDESLAKAQKNLITRLILAAALFLLPDLIMVVLNVFGITTNEVCVFKYK